MGVSISPGDTVLTRTPCAPDPEGLGPRCAAIMALRPQRQQLQVKRAAPARLGKDARAAASTPPASSDCTRIAVFACDGTTVPRSAACPFSAAVKLPLKPPCVPNLPLNPSSAMVSSPAPQRAAPKSACHRARRLWNCQIPAACAGPAAPRPPDRRALAAPARLQHRRAPEPVANRQLGQGDPVQTARRRQAHPPSAVSPAPESAKRSTATGLPKVAARCPCRGPWSSRSRAGAALGSRSLLRVRAWRGPLASSTLKRPCPLPATAPAGNPMRSTPHGATVPPRPPPPQAPRFCQRAAGIRPQTVPRSSCPCPGCSAPSAPPAAPADPPPACAPGTSTSDRTSYNVPRMS